MTATLFNWNQDSGYVTYTMEDGGQSSALGPPGSWWQPPSTTGDVSVTLQAIRDVRSWWKQSGFSTKLPPELASMLVPMAEPVAEPVAEMAEREEVVFQEPVLVPVPIAQVVSPTPVETLSEQQATILQGAEALERGSSTANGSGYVLVSMPTTLAQAQAILNTTGVNPTDPALLQANRIIVADRQARLAAAASTPTTLVTSTIDPSQVTPQAIPDASGVPIPQVGDISDLAKAEAIAASVGIRLTCQRLRTTAGPYDYEYDICKIAGGKTGYDPHLIVHNPKVFFANVVSQTGGAVVPVEQVVSPTPVSQPVTVLTTTGSQAQQQAELIEQQRLELARLQSEALTRLQAQTQIVTSLPTATQAAGTPADVQVDGGGGGDGDGDGGVFGFQMPEALTAEVMGIPVWLLAVGGLVAVMAVKS